MALTKHNFVNGSPPDIDADVLNEIEDEIIDAQTGDIDPSRVVSIDGGAASLVDDISDLRADISDVVTDVSGLDTDVTSLQNSQTPTTTAGTAPTFTVADATVTAYATGLRRTIIAHADSGTNPTLNFNSKGAKSVYQSTGKAASWKAGQVVTVYYNGTNFFTVSGGGGLELPATITAGTVPLYAFFNEISRVGDTYAVVRTKTIPRAGTYRFTYNLYNNRSMIRYIKMQKNGVDIPSSELVVSGTTPDITVNLFTIDVTVAAGDVITLLMKNNTSNSTYISYNSVWMIAIAWADYAAEI